MEDFKREPKTKTKDNILSSRQICENIHYFYYDLKGSFINQLCVEIVDDVINEEELKKLRERKETHEGQNIHSYSETDKDDDELEKKESKESEVVPKDKSNDQEDLDLIEQESPEKCLDESNNSDVIHEINVGEGICLEVFKDKEELVNDMTEQEVSKSIVEECRLREELSEKNEISKRQVFVCMGPIYN